MVYAEFLEGRSGSETTAQCTKHALQSVERVLSKGSGHQGNLEIESGSNFDCNLA